MDEPGSHPHPPDSDPVGRLKSLEAAQRRLWATLRQEDDPEVRMTLLSRFSENRAAIDELRQALGVEDGTKAYQVRLVEDGDQHAPGARGSGPVVDRHGVAEAPPAFISPPPAIGGERDRVSAASGHPDPEAPRIAPPPRVADDPYHPPHHRPPSTAADPTLYEEPTPTAHSAPDRVMGPPAAAAVVGSPAPSVADRQADAATDSAVGSMSGFDAESGSFGAFGENSTEQLKTSIRQVPARAYWLAGGAVAVLVMAWLVGVVVFGGDDSGNVDSEVIAGPEAQLPSEDIGAALRDYGFEGIAIEETADTVAVIGSVSTESERAAVLGAVRALAGDRQVDGTQLVVANGQEAAAGPTSEGGETISRPAAMQTELNRVVAATPIIFASSRADLTELHKRILNSVASIMLAYPDIPVKVVGFTDEAGPDEGNQALSLQRADAVKAYLIGQGVPEASLAVEAMGESTSSGSAAIASLERRVEFEVAGATTRAPVSNDQPLKIAVVAPSARNDLAFTQSMVDAVDRIAAERGNVEIAITDGTFVPEEAAAAIRSYAEQDFDLVIAHGSQFGSPLIEIANDHPDVAFAWGTASDTFGLPNVYAYDAAAGQGGYVLGAMAAALSQSGVVGVVGPIEVGDAQKYVDGFAAGAQAERPGVSVPITYTGSFSDLTLAAEAARAHVGSGADVMTGSAQMVVGAVSIASENNALWFGTQSNQAELAPSLVVASQVYRWEVILREIIADIEGGAVSGQFYTADLANGGIAIEYNPGYQLPDNVRQRADRLIAGIVNGSVVVPG